ncbi:MAG: hypothetical protein C4294_02890 [Nitrospiraceae bacterium]
MFLNVRPPGIRSIRRVSHCQMVNLICGSQNLTAEVRIVESSDAEGFSHKRKRPDQRPGLLLNRKGY